MLCRSLQLPSDSSPLLRYFRGERRCNSGRCTPWQRFAANELKSKSLRQTRTIIQLMAAERLERVANPIKHVPGTTVAQRAVCPLDVHQNGAALRENSRGQGSQVMCMRCPHHPSLGVLLGLKHGFTSNQFMLRSTINSLYTKEY